MMPYTKPAAMGSNMIVCIIVFCFFRFLGGGAAKK